MKGWCLRYCKPEKNIRSYISNDTIYTDITKFLDHLKFRIGLELKIYGHHFTKEFIMTRHIDDYNEKYINDIKEYAYVFYDSDMNYVCFIEVHEIIN